MGEKRGYLVTMKASVGALPIFGVITYIINDARYGEFDDYPLK
ncbi:hypothetical protein ODW06_23210 [Escherichia coli]|nr:hypothetical protein [Escherichia coli]MCV8730609.1 hypothetical protein [Escherichia coli]MCV8939299.1 hypothetical protein [Escherichia coli]MDC6996800.1 hypothetical protein [Escherichia coli]